MPDWNYHGLCPQLLRAVQHEDWLLPTPIQDEALPAILGGGDVCGAAETGSGKTAAFVLPILQLVQEELQTPVSLQSGPTSASASGKKGKKQNSAATATGPKILLSIDDRDSMLAVSQPDQLVCQSRMERQWCGVRATVGACSGARVYYEATVDDDGLCRVGWSTASAKLDVGTDDQSWGFGGTGKKSHGRKFITYGRAFGKGDVLGCVLDLKSRSVSFRLNGEDCGEAFKLPGGGALQDQVYFPAVVLKNAQMSFNFGCDTASRPMRFPPNPREGIIPLGSAPASQLRQGIKKSAQGKKDRRTGKSRGRHGGALSSPHALILAPTRDLAQQIHEWVEKLATFLVDPPIRSALIVGGDARQMGTLAGAHVVVGTCGRLGDMVKRGKISLSDTRFFVLDEADQMAADRESLATVRELYRACTSQGLKNQRSSRLQVCFFSATLHSKETRSLAEEITQHATWVDLKGKDVVPETVHHVVVPVLTKSPSAPWGKFVPTLDKFTDGVHERESDSLRPKNRQGASKEAKSQVIKRLKLEFLKKVVDTFHMDSCMIFCRTNLDCDNVERYLNALSSSAGGRGGGYQGKRESGKEDPYSCVVVAGKRRQQERRENLAAFRDGDVRFLVCTDVAARGIDLKELPFVINLTLPDDPAQYYHRIGRVGRAGKLGLAISVVAVEDDEKVWYHANCRRKGGVGCTNTRLLKEGGCCIYYNEPACLKRCEDKLGTPILRIVGDDLVLPEGMRVEHYGADADAVGMGASKQNTSTRITSLRPAVEELCEMEAEVQSMWLQTAQRFSRKTTK